jgi:hypothetical protein
MPTKAPARVFALTLGDLIPMFRSREEAVAAVGLAGYDEAPAA